MWSGKIRGINHDWTRWLSLVLLDMTRAELIQMETSYKDMWSSDLIYFMQPLYREGNESSEEI